MGTIKATNIEPIADNGTVTLGSSGDQFTLATGAKSSFLYPAFEAHLSAPNQSVTDAAITKVEIDTEVFDTNSCFDTSTYRFTPNVVGKYYVYGAIYHRTATSSNLSWGITYIYKNGSNYERDQIMQFSNNHGRQASVPISAIIDMNGTSDYLELFGSTNISSGSNAEFSAGTGKGTFFGAYRIGS